MTFISQSLKSSDRGQLQCLLCVNRLILLPNRTACAIKLCPTFSLTDLILYRAYRPRRLLRLSFSLRWRRRATNGRSVTTTPRWSLLFLAYCIYIIPPTSIVFSTTVRNAQQLQTHRTAMILRSRFRADIVSE